MNSGGIQTHDFLRRLQRLEESSLAPLLLELARVMEAMILEIECPKLEDIRKLQAAMRDLIGDAVRTAGRLRHGRGALRPVSLWGLSAFRVPLCLGKTGLVSSLDCGGAPHPGGAPGRGRLSALALLILV